MKKVLLNVKMCAWIFFTILVKNNSHYKKKRTKSDHKCTLVFMESTHHSFQISVSLDFSRKTFEKYSNIKCHEKPISGIRGVLCGRTNKKTDRQTDSQPDRQTDVTKLIVAFCNFAKEPVAFVKGNCSPVVRCCSCSSYNALVCLPQICLSQ